jgi:hypothetical protein
MFPTGSKYFFGLGFFALVAAMVYGAASADHAVNLDTFVGVMTFGYKGSVGDHAGYSVLVGLAGACFFLGCVTAAFRDADAEAVAQVAGVDSLPEVVPPGTASYLPIITAFAVGVVVVGLVAGAVFVSFGLIVLAFMIVEWTVKAWSDRATGDPAVNQAIRNRLMYPIEVPVLAAAGIAFFVLSIARLLLVMPDKVGSYLVFGLVPVVVLVGGWLVTSRPHLNRNLLTAALLVGGLAVLASGIVGASVKERELEHHEEEEEHEGEGSLAPLAPDAPIAPVQAPS